MIATGVHQKTQCKPNKPIKNIQVSNFKWMQINYNKRVWLGTENFKLHSPVKETVELNFDKDNKRIHFQGIQTQN